MKASEVVTQCMLFREEATYLENKTKQNRIHPTYKAAGILRLVAFNDRQRRVTTYVL
jgi:hypothetical protein